MTICIAFLRGINVGGHNKIKMVELKRMFEVMGLNQVHTYIQSGNVLFESEEEAEALRRRIAHEIGNVFSISVTVVLRTSLELERVIGNSPFSVEAVMEEQASSDVEIFYVSMLLASPSPEAIKQLSTFRSDGDEFRVEGREVYLLLRDGVRNSKLANNLHKLGVPSTMRNWNTLTKLAALAKAMEV